MIRYRSTYKVVGITATGFEAEMCLNPAFNGETKAAEEALLAVVRASEEALGAASHFGPTMLTVDGEFLHWGTEKILMDKIDPSEIKIGDYVRIETDDKGGFFLQIIEDSRITTVEDGQNRLLKWRKQIG